MTISAVIIAKNEAKMFPRCLESLAWCQEIVVIDDASSDETAAIATRLGAKVYSHPLENDFAKQRNYGLTKATGEWILFVDADEVVSSKLAQEIQKTIQTTRAQGFLIKRVDSLWGKTLQHGETGNIYLLRLARKDAGKWQGRVHETWLVAGKVEKLQHVLLHFPHPTISEFLAEINFYTSLRAEELHKKGVRATCLSILFYPKAKFVLNYFFRQGFRDGLPGLIFALLMSFHSFLVRGKLWQVQQRKTV